MKDVFLVPCCYMSSTATHSVVLIKKQNENRCSTDGEMSNFVKSLKNTMSIFHERRIVGAQLLHD